tara:strand:+ start:863 stop:1288 length:426 start_codon:yes stop_codon:yes gene_type:complete
MAWPKNEKAEEMYEAYKGGFSLADVALMYCRTRQSVWELFKSRGWKTRQPRKHLPFIQYNGSKYTIRNTGYYGKTNGKRTLLHRDVWENERGEIPDQHDIHHLDEDKRNNKVANLECLPKSEHTRKYSPHNNQYTKGRKRK